MFEISSCDENWRFTMPINCDKIVKTAQVKQARSYTENYDSLHDAVLRSYICVAVYDDLGREKNAR